jgi:MoaA/NifB/PqqE/SkfB family radical SAM enzyme
MATVMHKVLPIIIWRKSVEEMDSTPFFLKKIKNVRLLDILDQRLKRIQKIQRPIAIIDQYDKVAVAAIKKCGWLILVKNKRRLNDIKAVYSALRSDYLILSDIIYPFIDIELWENLIAKMEKENYSFLYNFSYFGIYPMAVVQKIPALTGATLKIATGRDNWWRAIKTVTSSKKYFKLHADKPIFADCLRSDAIDSEILNIFDDKPATLKTLDDIRKYKSNHIDSIFNMAQNNLYQLMLHSSLPHLTNRKLIEFESDNSLGEVKSFPYDIAITITSKCNLNCTFCNYTPGKAITKDDFTLADFKKMSWLKYVSKLGIGGGIGEPLLHPEFITIFRYLRNTHPHLMIRVISNGTLLDEAVCNEFAGNLTRIRISLNAATKETWKKLMRGHSFKKVCNAIALLSEIKQRIGSINPEIILVMVLNRQNIHETVKFIELASRLGVQSVQFPCFSKASMPKSEMPLTDSIYYDRRNTDMWLAEAEKKAKEAGIKIFSRPLPFSSKRQFYFHGNRTGRPYKFCRFPWQTCYVTRERNNPFKSKLDFCCFEKEKLIELEASPLTENYFKKLWNDPYIQHIRRTVNNGTAAGAACRLCRKKDPHDPNNYIPKV